MTPPLLVAVQVTVLPAVSAGSVPLWQPATTAVDSLSATVQVSAGAVRYQSLAPSGAAGAIAPVTAGGVLSAGGAMPSRRWAQPLISSTSAPPKRAWSSARSAATEAAKAPLAAVGTRS